jgi:hypothetical protein
MPSGSFLRVGYRGLNLLPPDTTDLQSPLCPTGGDPLDTRLQLPPGWSRFRLWSKNRPNWNRTFPGFLVLLDGSPQMPSKNKRVELEMEIMRYRLLGRQILHKRFQMRLKERMAELVQKLREIDE